MSGQTTTPSDNLSDVLGSNPQMERYENNLLVDLPGTTLPLVQLKLWNTIEEFYIRSTTRRRLVSWMMPAGVGEYDFNPYDGSWLVAWVLNVSGFGSDRFHVQPPALLLDDSGIPVDPGVAGVEPQQLQQFPVARSGYAELALKPANYNITFPPELFQQWFDAVEAGARARLFAMIGKAWSSPQLAGVYMKKFYKGVADARAFANNQGTNGANWRFPRMQGFAMGRRKQ